MSKKCRLCLKVIPSESVIKLYDFLQNTTEAANMVKLIAKYLDIKIKKDDIVSTMICQDCNDHLEEFHKFSEEVAAKQLTLGKDYPELELKKECSQFDDNAEEKNKSSTSSMMEEVENKIPTAEQAMFEYPIDMVKDELDSERDTDDLCIQDMLEADFNEDDAEEYKPPEDIQSSEVSTPIAKIRDFYNIWLKVKQKGRKFDLQCCKEFAENISGKQLNERNDGQLRKLIASFKTKWHKYHRKQRTFEEKNRVWLDRDFCLLSSKSYRLKLNTSQVHRCPCLSYNVSENTRAATRRMLVEEINHKTISIQDALALYIDMDLNHKTYNMMSSVVNGVHEDCFPSYPSIIEAKTQFIKDEVAETETGSIVVIKSEL